MRNKEIYRQINYLNNSMRELAQKGDAQAKFVEFTASATAFHLGAQREKGRERTMRFWEHGQPLELSIQGVTSLMKKMVAIPGTMEEKIASMHIENMTRRIAASGNSFAPAEKEMVAV